MDQVQVTKKRFRLSFFKPKTECCPHPNLLSVRQKMAKSHSVDFHQYSYMDEIHFLCQTPCGYCTRHQTHLPWLKPWLNVKPTGYGLFADLKMNSNIYNKVTITPQATNVKQNRTVLLQNPHQEKYGCFLILHAFAIPVTSDQLCTVKI